MLNRILLIPCVLFLCAGCSAPDAHSGDDLFDLNVPVSSRSISFENPTGAPGEGGKVASHLGVGRKGDPARILDAGETKVLCHITGPGTIRHIWMTGEWQDFSWLAGKDRGHLLRSMVIRATWEGQAHPSIECPLGDFMGLAHGEIVPYQSAVHSVGRNAALNFWLPMPFTEAAEITLTNESDTPITLYYQIDYTVDDPHPGDVGRLHACFRRENPTTLTQDFVILPQRHGKGRFLGALMGVRTLEGAWWGEGEIKIYMDGDDAFPTICGTGSEDYICLSYGVQETPFLYHGCSLNENGYISMYRWHLPDPIYWRESCRITIQQIGWNRAKSGTPESGLYERQDDWCSTAFWYEPVPSAPLPPFPSTEARMADLPTEEE